MKQIQVMIKEPGQPAQIRTINSTLEALQGAVNGFIEVIPASHDKAFICICNENGITEGLQPNSLINGRMIFGNIVAAGIDERGNIVDYPGL